MPHIRPMPTLLSCTALLLAACGQAPTASFAALPAAEGLPRVGEAVAPPSVTMGHALTRRASDAAVPLPGPSATPPQLDMLTLNTWGKPGVLGTDLKRRFRLIGDAVQGHDVVTMQETFTGYAADLERTAGYPTFIRPRNGGFLKLNSGLTVLSRYPVLALDFAVFTDAGAADQFARKGVLFTRLKVPGVGPVDVYDTHFQAKGGEPYDTMRLHDVDVLAGLVAKHRDGYPTFIMGDFNMGPDSASYHALLAKLPVRDAFAEAHPGVPGYTADPRNTNRPAKSKSKRIDFIFIGNGDDVDVRVDAAAVVLDQPVEGTFVSDHFGLNGHFSLLRHSP